MPMARARQGAGQQQHDHDSHKRRWCGAVIVGPRRGAAIERLVDVTEFRPREADRRAHDPRRWALAQSRVFIFYFLISRSRPTANAKGPWVDLNVPKRRASPEDLFPIAILRFESSLRRSPSACPEKLSKNRWGALELSYEAAH